MDITRQSYATGEWHTMDIPVTIEAYSAWYTGRDKRHVQDAFPWLSDSQREFLISGTTPEEWDALYGDWDDDEDDNYTGYEEN